MINRTLASFFAFWVAGAAAGLSASPFLNAWTAPASDFGSRAAAPLDEPWYTYTGDDATPGLTVTELRPQDVELRIVPTAEWRATTGAGVRAYARLGAPGRPCRIVLPEGFRVRAERDRFRAWFEDEDVAQSIAHELLHCARGQWHPPYPESNLPLDPYPPIAVPPVESSTYTPIISASSQLVTAGTSQLWQFALYAEGGKLVLSFDATGKVTLGDGVALDEASAAFWHYAAGNPRCLYGVGPDLTNRLKPGVQP